MTCRETQPLLSPFFDGELDPAQMRSVALHSARCTACEEELHRLERLQQELFGRTNAVIEQVDLNAVWAGVESRIGNISQPWLPRLRAWLEDLLAMPLRVPILAGGVAAALVAVLLWVVPLRPATPGSVQIANVDDNAIANSLIDNSAIVDSLDSHVGSVALLNEPETNTSVLWVNEDSPDAADFGEVP